jgi:hypothetical protein
VYVAATSPFTVTLVPDEVYVFPVGDSVRVQIPDEGNPFNTTLPGVLQVALVMVPTDGAVAGVGAGFITTLADGPEVHEPAETVNV